jgi:hypothetical protein
LLDSFVSFDDAGEYVVFVRDALGSVVSKPAVLNVTGPLLRVIPLPGTNAPNALIQLQWNVWDYCLEACADLTEGAWRDVEGAYSGMVLPVSGPQTFYRLRWIGD